MSLPVLWHIPVSHFNEKVRWALEHKGVAHERRAPPPPSHIAVALWLTRGRSATFPVLVFEDGTAVGDSTAIIAALERRHPQPALYPADPAERARALALEELFDTELAPYARRLAFHELRTDADGIAAFATTMLPGPVAASAPVQRAAGRLASGFARVRYRAGDDAAADTARAKVVAALDRLEAELERAGGEHLAGGAFSVADLTAASLFVPIVRPPEGPVLPAMPPAYEAFVAGLRDRPGFQWVQATFARHRGAARRP